MLPQRSTTSMWQVSPLTVPSRCTVGSPVVTSAAAARRLAGEQALHVPGQPGLATARRPGPYAEIGSLADEGGPCAHVVGLPAGRSPRPGSGRRTMPRGPPSPASSTRRSRGSRAAVDGSSASGPSASSIASTCSSAGPWPHRSVFATWTPCHSAVTGSSQVAENAARSSPPTSPGSTSPPECRHARAAERVDRLRHEATTPGVAGRLRLRGHVGTGGRCRVDEPFEHRRVDRVREQLAVARGSSVAQPQVRRGRPAVAEQVLHAFDRGGDAGEDGMTVAGVADRRLEDGRERERPVVAQQQQPGVHGSRHGGRQRTGAGDVVESHGRERLRCRSGRSRTLPAEHARRRVRGGRDDRGEVATGPVEVWLDHVQHEAARCRGVEGVAAELEHPLRRLRGQPVRRGHHPEGAFEGGSSREHQCRSSGCTRRVRRVVASMS